VAPQLFRVSCPNLKAPNPRVAVDSELTRVWSRGFTSIVSDFHTVHTMIPIRRLSPRINAPEVLHDSERSQSNKSRRPLVNGWARPTPLASLRMVHGPANDGDDN
jgi:hypothetical protein